MKENLLDMEYEWEEFKMVIEVLNVDIEMWD